MRLVLIGLAGGFFSTLFGVGGGIVIVPLLLLFTTLGLRVAGATSLAAIGITAAAGTVTYAFHGQLEPLYAALVGFPAALGAIGGATIQQRVPTRTLSFLFAALLVALAVRLMLG